MHPVGGRLLPEGWIRLPDRRAGDHNIVYFKIPHGEALAASLPLPQTTTPAPLPQLDVGGTMPPTPWQHVSESLLERRTPDERTCNISLHVRAKDKNKYFAQARAKRRPLC